MSPVVPNSAAFGQRFVSVQLSCKMLIKAGDDAEVRNADDTETEALEILQQTETMGRCCGRVS